MASKKSPPSGTSTSVPAKPSVRPTTTTSTTAATRSQTSAARTNTTVPMRPMVTTTAPTTTVPVSSTTTIPRTVQTLTTVSYQEAKSTLEKFDKIYSDLQTLYDKSSVTGGGLIKYGKKSYSQSEFKKKFLQPAEKQYKDAKKQFEVVSKPIEQNKTRLAKIQKDIKAYEKIGSTPGTEEAKTQLQNEAKTLEVNIKSALTGETPTTTTPPATPTTTVPTAPTTTVPGATQTPTTVPSPATVTETGAPATTPSVVQNLQNPSARNKIGATPATGGGGGGTGGGGGAAVPAATGKPKNPKVGQTWVGPKGATWTWDGKKWKVTARAEVAPAVDYEDLKSKFPQYSWILDLGPENQDTKDLTADYLTGKITIDRWNELAPGTSWFTSDQTKNTTRKIKNLFGDVGLSSGEFSKLVSDTINFKYDDNELGIAFYSKVFERDPITNEYKNSAAAKTTLGGSAASWYRNYAKNMFTTISDGQVEEILTGKSTQEDFDRTTRTINKNVYGKIADLLDDPTMTMAKIVQPWRDMAANVLEMDPSQIDMSKPEYQIAYNSATEGGEKKALSLGEWYQKLRTDDVYNWKNTNNAKEGARTLAYNITRAFGKII